MNTKEQFTILIEQEKDVLDFLEKLSPEERKSLVPSIKKMHKYYVEHIDDGINNYGYKQTRSRGSQVQLKSLKYSGYFCFNKKEYKKIFRNFYRDFYEDKIAERFRPDWFGDFINEANWGITYKTIIEYQQKGWLNPNKVLICHMLPSAIWENIIVDGRHQHYNFVIENLLLDEVTLKEHIWFLFTEESEIHIADRYIHYKDGKHSGWFYTFKTLIEQNKIDRQRVLKECLLSSTRNFNKVLTSWFFKLLEYLKPSPAEILSLQEEVLMVLNGAHSKPINICLAYIKRFCETDKFKTQNFIDIVPVLLTSDVKAVINNTMMVLEKIVKKDKALQKEICLLIASIFISTDEKMQIKAAKFILKYGDQRESIKAEVSNYYDNLYTSIKDLLLDYKTENATESIEEEELVVEKIQRIRSDNEIEQYNSVEELIFFFSQVFENNEDYDFDLFVDLLPKLDAQLDATQVSKLEPAFQRAMKTINKWANTIGLIEPYMAITFVDYTQHLFEKFPKETKKMQSLYERTLKENKERGFSKTMKLEVLYVKLESSDQNKFNQLPFLNQLFYTLKLTLEKWDVPILATPTHTPSWLDFSAFIKRLSVYQKQKRRPSLFDFQIAVARLVLENDIAIKKQIKQNLKGEYQNILLYLAGNNLDLSLCKTPSFWLAAIYRKGNKKDLDLFLKEFDKAEKFSFLSTNPSWLTIKKGEKFLKYNYEKEKKEQAEKQYTELTFTDDFVKDIDTEWFSNHLNDIFFLKNNNLNIFCQSIYSHGYSLGQDNKKLLLLSPFQPELQLSVLTQRELTFTNWEDAEFSRSSIYVLSLLAETWDDFGESAYLYLACSFFYIKKTSRQLAAEIWQQASSQQTMNHTLLGKTLGKLHEYEYAPLKRFTDLIVTQMINISKKHNQVLEVLIANMIPAMGDTPVRGTKKLLEIYLELLQLNNSEITTEIQIKLKVWNQKSLNTIAEKMNK